MNTGDSCLISPYVPHSFTSRDQSQFAAIVACTFSGYVRDVLPDLLHHSITDMVSAAGDMRRPESVRANLIARFAEFKGMTVANVRDQVVSKSKGKLAVERVAAVVSGEVVDEEVTAAICTLLNLYPEQLRVHEMEESDEVTYQVPPAEQPDPTTCADWTTYPLASSRHTPGVGGYLLTLRGEHSSTSPTFSYLYNYGKTPVVMAWAGRTQTLAAGDSAVVKPFVEVVLRSSSGAAASIISVKVPGSANLRVAYEMSLFAPEGLANMTTGARWF